MTIPYFDGISYVDITVVDSNVITLPDGTDTVVTDAVLNPLVQQRFEMADGSLFTAVLCRAAGLNVIVNPKNSLYVDSSVGTAEAFRLLPFSADFTTPFVGDAIQTTVLTYISGGASTAILELASYVDLDIIITSGAVSSDNSTAVVRGVPVNVAAVVDATGIVLTFTDALAAAYDVSSFESLIGPVLPLAYDGANYTLHNGISLGAGPRATVNTIRVEFMMAGFQIWWDMNALPGTFTPATAGISAPTVEPIAGGYAVVGFTAADMEGSSFMFTSSPSNDQSSFLTDAYWSSPSQNTIKPQTATSLQVGGVYSGRLHPDWVSAMRFVGRLSFSTNQI